MQRERRIANTEGIYRLWFGWLLAVGSLAAVPVISLYVPKTWLPLFVFALEIGIYFFARHNRVSKAPSCLRLHHIAMVTLFWTALIMALINLLYTVEFTHDLFWGELTNPQIPFISILILAPVAFIVTFFNLRMGFNASVCQDCQARHGSVAERGFLGRLYSQEGEYLSRMLLMLSFLISILSWFYYFVFYINANINMSDEFIFVWAQAMVFVMTLIYLGIRYFSLWLYYCQNIDGHSLRYSSSSLIRYIIICDDCVFLKKPDVNQDTMSSDESRIDTPARLFLQYKKEIGMIDAEQYFCALSGLNSVKLRFLYENTNFKSECNIFHYAYFANDRFEVDNSRLKGDWFTLPQIKKMMANNEISTVFGSELERIYTVAMSWKTYDKYGHRLYDIKNYKPTFRLQDLKDWDVDFNDITWLFISANNADRPFFYLRNFWNKYICGIGLTK